MWIVEYWLECTSEWLSDGMPGGTWNYYNEFEDIADAMLAKRRWAHLGRKARILFDG